MNANNDRQTEPDAAMEEGVRDVFQAVVSTLSVPDSPPGPAPAPGSRAARAAWRLRYWAPRARVRALIPVAAAAGVAAIAVTAAVVVPGLTGSAPGGAVASPAAGPLGGAPRFFAGLAGQASKKSFVTVVKIYSTTTGRPISVLTAQKTQEIGSVARLGNDRTFVVTAYDRKACTTHFLRLSIDAAGKAGWTTPLSVPTIRGDVEQIAASADGKVVGFALSPCRRGSLQMAVIHLATGTVTRWDNPGVGGSPSLTADGSVYGFVSSRTERSKAIAWTIRTDAPAGPLYTYARKVLDLPNGVNSAILSPSGAQLYAETSAGSGTGPRVLVLNLYSTGTGTLIRQVLQLKPVSQLPSYVGLSLDAASRHLLVSGLARGRVVKAYDLRTGRSLSLTVRNLAIDGGISTLAW